MSDSPLVSYVKISPNSSPRTEKIIKITPHYMAGNLSIESCGDVFAPTSRQASSNYGIGSDGRVACYVHESRRAWTSSSGWNDQKAVTIECANVDNYGTLTEKCWASLVDLCVDICQRNGIPYLEYTGNKNGSLTRHCFFSDTSCPGNYIKDNTARLVQEVNARLNGEEIIDKNLNEIMEALMSIDCIIQPNGIGRLDAIIDGEVHPAHHPDEIEAIKTVYRMTHDGKEIPQFQLGEKDAPWASRLYDILSRPMDRTGVPVMIDEHGKTVRS